MTFPKRLAIKRNEQLTVLSFLDTLERNGATITDSIYDYNYDPKHLARLN